MCKGGSPEIKNCTIKNNRSAGSGGGIYYERTDMLLITDSEISANYTEGRKPLSAKGTFSSDQICSVLVYSIRQKNFVISSKSFDTTFIMNTDKLFLSSNCKLSLISAEFF